MPKAKVWSSRNFPEASRESLQALSIQQSCLAPLTTLNTAPHCSICVLYLLWKNHKTHSISSKGITLKQKKKKIKNKKIRHVFEHLLPKTKITPKFSFSFSTNKSALLARVSGNCYGCGCQVCSTQGVVYTAAVTPPGASLLSSQQAECRATSPGRG